MLMIFQYRLLLILNFLFDYWLLVKDGQLAPELSNFSRRPGLVHVGRWWMVELYSRYGKRGHNFTNTLKAPGGTSIDAHLGSCLHKGRGQVSIATRRRVRLKRSTSAMKGGRERGWYERKWQWWWPMPEQRPWGKQGMIQGVDRRGYHLSDTRSWQTEDGLQQIWEERPQLCQ